MLARTVLMALCRSRDSASQRFPNCSLQRASRMRTRTVFGDEKKRRAGGNFTGFRNRERQLCSRCYFDKGIFVGRKYDFEEC